jgi:Dolichyl-phosphate-mannose-protein mannosyltransferase
MSTASSTPETAFAVQGRAETNAGSNPSARRLALGLVALASIVYLVVVLMYARMRPIAKDEGFYTSAARLVWEGKTPNRDFAYHQGPALPYIYSLVWGVGGHSLIALRSLSAILGTIAVALWGIWLIRINRFSIAIALGVFLVILANPQWIIWNVVVKTFAVANLMMSIAVMALYTGLRGERRRWLFVAGAAIGITVSVRLLYAPLLPFAALWLIWEWRKSQLQFSSVITFVSGAVCGLIPTWLSLAADWQAYIFNNVQYRPLLARHVSFRNSAHVVADTVFGLLSEPLYSLTLLLALVGGWSLIQLRRRKTGPYTPRDYLFFKLVFAMLAIYALTALIPYPVYSDYYASPLFPFLVFFIAEGLRVAYQAIGRPLILLACAAPLLCIRVLGAEDTVPPPLLLSSFHRVTQLVQANSRPNDVVISIWPGYVLESGRRYFPGTENHFNYPVAANVSPATRRRFHLVSGEEIIAAVSAGAADLLIFDTDVDKAFHIPTAAELQKLRAAVEQNYRPVGRVDFPAPWTSDSIEIYRLRDRSGSQ